MLTDAPPHDMAAERAVLGSALLDRNALARAVEGLSAEDFYCDGHRIIFRAMTEFIEREKSLDLVTFTHHLEIAGKLETAGGATYIASLPNATPTAANVDAYIAIVRDQARRRTLLATAQTLQRAATNGDDPAATVRTLLDVAAAAGPVSVALSDDMAPWPEPVDGPALVDGLIGFFLRHAVLPAGGALVLALWAVGTWLIDAFDAFPYLAVTSPQRECGKSLVLKLLGCLCRRPLPTANISEAALFRVIEKETPTLFIDEAQQLRVRDERSAALHDLLCAGYQRGAAFVYRMAGAHRDELRRFSVYCAKAIALIGKMTDVLMDRAIEIRMRRRTPRERVDRFFVTRPPAEVSVLRQQMARWTADHRDDVRDAYLEGSLPDWLADREAELWSPVLAVVRVAAPDRLREVERTAKRLAGLKVEADDSIGVRLLADLRAILAGHDFLPTQAILTALVAIEDGPWSEYRNGKSLTAKGLADLLKPFEIGPGKTRYDGQVGVRGYFRIAFRDAWERYLSNDPSPDPPQVPQALSDKARRDIFDPPPAPIMADGEIAGNASSAGLVAGVAPVARAEGEEEGK